MSGLALKGRDIFLSVPKVPLVILHATQIQNLDQLFIKGLCTMVLGLVVDIAQQGRKLRMPKRKRRVTRLPGKHPGMPSCCFIQ